MPKRRLHRSSESTLAKTPHCWKSHVAAQMFLTLNEKIFIFELCIKTNQAFHSRVKS